MKENPEEKKIPVIKRPLNLEEEKEVARLRQKKAGNPHSIFRNSKTNQELTVELDLNEKLTHQDAFSLIEARIMEATGSAYSSMGIRLLSSMGKAVISSKAKNEELAAQLNDLADSMRTFAPQDEYEGQLVSQLIILHEHAMEWLGRALHTERVDFSNVYLNGASKLLTRHHETLESLLKYRRKGEQRVHVEHVHVHDGAQAIVGNVTSGGGLKQKLEEGPHAKV